MAIAKATSRSVAVKAGKTSEAVFETQASFVTREMGGLSASSESLDDDVERNAELYILKYKVMQN